MFISYNAVNYANFITAQVKILKRQTILEKYLNNAIKEYKIKRFNLPHNYETKSKELSDKEKLRILFTGSKDKLTICAEILAGKDIIAFAQYQLAYVKSDANSAKYKIIAISDRLKC